MTLEICNQKEVTFMLYPSNKKIALPILKQFVNLDDIKKLIPEHFGDDVSTDSIETWDNLVSLNNGYLSLSFEGNYPSLPELAKQYPNDSRLYFYLPK